MSAAELRVAVDGADSDNALLVTHPHHAPASQLVPLIEHNGKHGFLVVDMPDVDDFALIASVRLRAGPLYLINRLDRCDHMANWSPDEALPAITAAGRTPLSLSEGIHWLLQQPEMLQRNHCFMTIGSQLPKPNGSLNARTPALWINNGTGCDGPDNRNAPKAGWCSAGGRHTGSASPQPPREPNSPTPPSRVARGIAPRAPTEPVMLNST